MPGFSGWGERFGGLGQGGMPLPGSCLILGRQLGLVGEQGWCWEPLVRSSSWKGVGSEVTAGEAGSPDTWVFSLLCPGYFPCRGVTEPSAALLPLPEVPLSLLIPPPLPHS